MEILWVNHASFVIESKGIRLLADPWIAGTAFNDSWELLVPSRFETKDFDGITHTSGSVTSTPITSPRPF